MLLSKGNVTNRKTMQYNSIQKECKQDWNPDYMQHGQVSIVKTVGCQWSWMFTILDNTHQVDYTDIYAKDKHHVAFSKCSGFFICYYKVFDRCVIRLYAFNKTTVSINFHVYDRIRIAGGFTIIRHHSFTPSADRWKEIIHTSVAGSLRHLNSN
jgi:hypothetical protein